MSIFPLNPSTLNALAMPLIAPIFGSCDKELFFTNLPEIYKVFWDLKMLIGTLFLGGFRIAFLNSINSSTLANGFNISFESFFPSISTPSVHKNFCAKNGGICGFFFLRNGKIVKHNFCNIWIKIIHINKFTYALQNACIS